MQVWFDASEQGGTASAEQNVQPSYGFQYHFVNIAARHHNVGLRRSRDEQSFHQRKS